MAVDLAKLQGIGLEDENVCGPDGVCAVPEKVVPAEKPPSSALRAPSPARGEGKAATFSPLPPEGRVAAAGWGWATSAAPAEETPTPDSSPQGGGERGGEEGGQ